MGGLAPSLRWSDVREVIFSVAVGEGSAAAQVGHCRAVIHAFRYLDSDTEQLEFALIPVGIAEPVGHHVLVTGANALESIEVPVPAKHALSALENLFSFLREHGIDDDGIVLHDYIPFQYRWLMWQGLAPLPWSVVSRHSG